ncbi:uncharacterized protein [Periplaneta americana]|uniref:uncharacterized protein n=1 Tax=Periplaneta americana TaxID=6978 RepID=UPI0037E9BB36
MFGARVSLLILFLSSFYQDLETKDVKCDIGAPPITDFSLADFSRGRLSYMYTVLTNSKIFTDSICFLVDNFKFPMSTMYSAATGLNSFGEKERQTVYGGIRYADYRNGKLIMDYRPDFNTKIFTVLSGNYTVIATDNLSYLILGACLESFEKPFIRVLIDSEWLDDGTEKNLRKELKSLGLDESKFMRINRTICPYESLG